MLQLSRKYSVIIFIVALLVFLIYTATTKATAFYYTVDEYVAELPNNQDRLAQIKGTVVPGSIEWDALSMTLTFTIEENGKQLPVVYNDLKPDTFQDSIEVVVTGRMNDQNVFAAEKLLVKCPSKYEAVDGETGSDAHGGATSYDAHVDAGLNE